MKALLLAAAVLIAIAVAGWISVGVTDSSATVTIDRQEIHKDTAQLTHTVRDAFRGVIETGDTDRSSANRLPTVDKDAAAQATP